MIVIILKKEFKMFAPVYKHDLITGEPVTSSHIYDLNTKVLK